jgi:hypothetical protein
MSPLLFFIMAIIRSIPLPYSSSLQNDCGGIYASLLGGHNDLRMPVHEKWLVLHNFYCIFNVSLVFRI